jgi:hypothetical protein
MRGLLLILLFGVSNYLIGQTISFQDFFSLKGGASKVFYVSHITDKDTIKDKNTYSFCRSLFIKGKEIFYFEDGDDIGDTTIIGSNSFCHGVFYFDSGALFFSPIFWKYELKQANLEYFEPLFPTVISFGTIYKIQDGEEKRKYNFTGFEEVVVNGKVFKNCLKLTISQDWKTAHYVDTLWFEKGVGVIKWLRSTGRLEEVKL